MALAPRTLNLRVAITGDAEEQFKDLARAGEQAFTRIRQAADRGRNVDINVAQVSRQLQELARAGQQAFQQVERSARSAGNEIATTGQRGTQAMAQVGAQATDTARRVSTLGAAFRNVAIGIGVISGFAAAAGAAMFKLAQNAANAATEVGKASTAAGVAARQFQQQQFALRQSGLEASDAAAAQKKLKDATDDVIEAARKAFAARGTLFAPGEAGARAIAEQLQAVAGITSNTGTQLDFVKRKLVEFGVVVDPLTGKIRENAAQFVALAEGIRRMSDPAQQSRLVLGLFGDELGRKLLPVLRRGGDELSRFLDDFGRLGLGVSDDAIKKAQEFQRVMQRFGEATKASRQELGSLFVEPVAAVIEGWTTALRANQTGLIRLGETLRSAIMPVLRDFVAVIAGNRNVDTRWLVTLRDVIVNVGTAIKDIFLNVAVPAFKALSDGAKFVADTINNAFGTDLSTAAVAVSGVITFLIGGFNALALAVGAVFAGEGPGFDAFREKLKTLGIDIVAIRDTVKNVIKTIAADFQALFEGRDSDVQNTFLITLRDGIVNFARELPGIVNTVKSAFKGLMDALDFVAQKINETFGTELTGAGLLVVFFLAQITGALDGFSKIAVIAAAGVSIFVNAFSLLALLLSPAGLIAVGVIALAFLIISNWDKIRDFGIAAFNKIKEVAVSVWDFITGSAETFVQQLARVFQNLTNPIVLPFRLAADAIRRIWEGIIGLIQRALGLSREAMPEGGGGGFATGGYTGNVGTRRIAGFVHGQEYVEPAHVVAQPGVRAFLELLRRNGGDLQSAISRFTRGFSTGGFVDSLSRNFSIPGYAAGGFVAPAAASSGRPVVINLPNGGQVGGLTATPSAIRELVKYSIGSQVRSGGKKPGWYR